MSESHPTMTKAKNRYVVVEMVHFQPIDGQPVSHESRFNRRVDSEEQPYGPRRTRVTDTWTEIDLGWLRGDNVGQLIIQNDEGKGLQTQPSPEEIRDIKSRVIEVSMGDSGPLFRIPPGESIRLTSPAPELSLRLRCVNGPARITFIAFPA